MVCGRLTAAIAGSNPAEGMDVRLFCLFCVMHVVASFIGDKLCVSVCDIVSLGPCVGG